MGNRKPLKINIADPCTESWDEMLPEHNGRFCLSCQKRVIDFSEMSDNEILRTISTAGKNCCGRFETNQLDRFIIPQPKPSAPFLPTALLVTLLGAIIPETGKAQQVTNITASATAASDIHVPRHIEGRIIDAATREGVPRVTILMKGSSTGCTSDETGCFKLNIPQSHYNEYPIFRVSCVGYDEMEFELDSSYTAPYTISLNKTTNILNEVNVVAYTTYRKGGFTTGAVTCIKTTTFRRDSWWYRFTRIFRKKQQQNDD